MAYEIIMNFLTSSKWILLVLLISYGCKQFLYENLNQDTIELEQYDDTETGDWDNYGQIYDVEPSSNYLFFDVPKEIAEQRVAILQGILIGHLMNCTVVLPQLDNGFAKTYNLKILREYLRPYVRILEQLETKETLNIQLLDVKEKNKPPEYFIEKAGKYQSWRVDNSYLALNVSQSENLTEMFWKINLFLRYSRPIESQIKKILAYLDQDFSSISIMDSDASEYNLSELISKFNEENKQIFVSTDIDEPKQDSRFKDIFTNSINVLTIQDIASLKTYNRQVKDIVQFELCRLGKRFIGNSFHPFSALLFSIRQFDSLTNFDYNSNHLLSFFNKIQQSSRLTRLNWVFTITSDSTPEYVSMMKIAVLTSKARTTLKPVCIFGGNPNHISDWLLKNDVQVFFHTPKWKDQLIILAGVVRNENYAKLDKSPLYGYADGVVGAFLRIDTPNILKDEKIAFYTDVDVYFVSDVLLSSLSIPKVLSCSIESTCFNSGVLLMNLDALRESYNDFLDFILNKSPKDLIYKFGGPLDQGAINTFYKYRISELTHEYNWRPYWGINKKAIIIHLHGPKPKDYKEYETTKFHKNINFQTILSHCYAKSDCLIVMDYYYQLLEKFKNYL